MHMGIKYTDPEPAGLAGYPAPRGRGRCRVSSVTYLSVVARSRASDHGARRCNALAPCLTAPRIIACTGGRRRLQSDRDVSSTRGPLIHGGGAPSP